MLRGRPASVHDYREMARWRLPRVMFDYLDGGALDEVTLRRNTADMDGIEIPQRVLAVPSARTGAELLGQAVSMPVMLAPLGSLGMMYPKGEILAFQAAHDFGIGAALSSFSIAAIEDLAPFIGPADAFQLYMMKDPARSDELLARARAAGFQTLIVTVDTTHTGMRDRDLRNGYRSAVKITPRLALDALAHPRWLAQTAGSALAGLGNFRRWDGVGRGLLQQAAFMARQLKKDITWEDISRLRRDWPGRLVVKGVLSCEDLDAAIRAGADAVVVSNHGGRQLDGARSSIAALPSLAEAARGRTALLFDSGIRRGSHLYRAIGLGAEGCLIGRAYAYALAARGREGVTEVLTMLRQELEMTMTLSGIDSIAGLRFSLSGTAPAPGAPQAG